MPRPPDVRGPPTAAPQCPLLVPVQAVQPLCHLFVHRCVAAPARHSSRWTVSNTGASPVLFRCPRQHMAQGEHDGVADRITFQQRPDQRDECRDVVMKPGVQTLPW